MLTEEELQYKQDKEDKDQQQQKEISQEALKELSTKFAPNDYRVKPRELTDEEKRKAIEDIKAHEEYKQKKKKKNRLDEILSDEEEELAYREYEYARMTDANVPDDEEIPGVVHVKDLIRYVARSSDYRMSEVEDVIRHFIHVIRYLVIENESIVMLRGLGHFRLQKYPESVVYSGLTQAKYYIPPYRQLMFRQDKGIKDEVNKYSVQALTYEISDEEIRERGLLGLDDRTINGYGEIEYRPQNEDEVTDAEFNEWLSSFDSELPLERRQNRRRRKVRIETRNALREKRQFERTEVLDPNSEIVSVHTGQRGRPRKIRLPKGIASGPSITVDEFERIKRLVKEAKASE